MRGCGCCVSTVSRGFGTVSPRFRAVSPRFRAVSERSERLLYIKVGCIGAASVRSRPIFLASYFNNRVEKI